MLDKFVDDKPVQNIPKTLIQGLLFPAIVGAGFTFILQKIGRDGIPETLFMLEFWFGILLLIYFISSYLANDRVQNYNWSFFIIDLIEIISMFIALYSLGYIDFKLEPNYQILFIALIIPPVLHLIWNKLTHKEVESYLTILSFLRITLCLVGIFFLYPIMWFNVLFLISYTIFSIVYIYKRLYKTRYFDF